MAEWSVGSGRWPVLPGLVIVLASLGIMAGCAQWRPPARLPTPAEARPAPAAPPSGRVAEFAELPGWGDDRHAEALAVFLKGCSAIRPDKLLASVCGAARGVPAGDDAAARAFFESRFEPIELINGNGSTDGLITGYYEPIIRACRERKPGCSVPVHGVPDDLLTIELATIDPDLKGKRLRGRLEGRKVVPYLSRTEIDARSSFAGGDTGTADRKPLPAAVMAWATDPVDVFFLQVQGSGRLQMDDGSVLRIGYADQNGHPYRAVGKSLIERGALTRDTVSMQSIRDWLAANPSERDAVLATNPSYVFFRELPPGEEGPPGSLGVALTPGRSIAVDVNAVPLGSPVWLVTTDPGDGSPIRRLMSAQDTGGAIRGSVRADLFWGRGEAAASKAGRMQQLGRMWVLRVRP